MPPAASTSMLTESEFRWRSVSQLEATQSCGRDLHQTDKGAAWKLPQHFRLFLRPSSPPPANGVSQKLTVPPCACVLKNLTQSCLYACGRHLTVNLLGMLAFIECGACWAIPCSWKQYLFHDRRLSWTTQFTAATVRTGTGRAARCGSQHNPWATPMLRACVFIMCCRSRALNNDLPAHTVGLCHTPCLSLSIPH